MASGVKVHEDVKAVFQCMKKVPTGDKQDERIRVVVLDIDDGFIVVKEQFANRDLGGVNAFEFFKGKLQEKCCYLLYDCHFEIAEGEKDELVFVMWCPGTDCAKNKMHFSASKDALKKTLGGVKHCVEMQDYEDCNTEDDFAAMLKTNKEIRSLEGKPLKACKHGRK